MITRFSGLRKFHLECRDGTIGKVKDLFFDDDTWRIRYVVADTGKWLTGRRVLLSPTALVPSGADHGKLPVNLTKGQIEQSPGINDDRPVSEQYQSDLHSYYGWQPYWAVAPYPMGGVFPPASTISVPRDNPMRSDPPKNDPPGDPHLRSAAQVKGYAIHAQNGTLGHVDDFLVAFDEWTVCGVVIDTRNWLPGRKVVIPPSAIDRVSWTEREVSVHLDRETIEHSPELPDDRSRDIEFAQQLTSYYQGVGSHR